MFLTFNESRSAPAVGTNLVIPVPVVAELKLVFLSFSLLTDANADDRVVQIVPDTSEFDRLIASSAIAQSASTTFNYIASFNATTNAAGQIGTRTIPLPDVRFQPAAGDTITINIIDINVGDQISDTIAGWHIWRG